MSLHPHGLFAPSRCTDHLSGASLLYEAAVLCRQPRRPKPLLRRLQLQARHDDMVMTSPSGGAEGAGPRAVGWTTELN